MRACVCAYGHSCTCTRVRRAAYVPICPSLWHSVSVCVRGRTVCVVVSVQCVFLQLQHCALPILYFRSNSCMAQALERCVHFVIKTFSVLCILLIIDF